MAQKRTIDIDINTNADQAAKEFENLGKATKVANDSLEGLNKTFEEANGDIQPLTARMGEAEDRLYELALAGDTTSKEYQGLLNKVGEYRKVQIQTDLAVDQAATTMSQKLGTALTGATSGFAAVQGVMALTGGESKELEESLLKVQGAMAIQQGVQGVLEYSKAVGLATKATKLWGVMTGATTGMFKLLRVALISTGIGAIVVGIGLLIANFSKVTSFVQKGIKSFDKLGGVMKIILLPITAVIEGFKLVKMGLQAVGVLESEHEKASKARHKAKMERHLEESRALSQERDDIRETLRVKQKALDDEIEMLEAQGKQTTKLERQKLLEKIEASKKAVEVSRKQLALEIKDQTFFIEFERNMLEARLGFVKENERKLAVFDAKINTEKVKNYQKHLDDKTAADKKRSEELQKELDNEIDAEIKLLAELDKIKRANEDALRTDEENELLRVEEKYDVLEAMAFGNAEALNEIEIARLNARNEIFLKFDNEAYDAQKALDDKAIADKKAAEKEKQDIEIRNKEFAIQSTLDTLSLVSDITELFGKKGEKQAKRAFNVQKAANIATATIETYVAAQKAYTSQIVALDPTSPVRGAIAAGIAVASGLANVAKIASQKFEGGGGGGGGSDFSADGVGGGEQQAPSFNIVGNSSVNQLAQLQQAPVQAFVVSGEVTTSQALDRNRVENATL